MNENSLEEAFRKLYLDTPLTPTTLKWEKMVNDPILKNIYEQSGLPEDKMKKTINETYLLSPEYFRKVAEERDYPYPLQEDYTQRYQSGFAPYSSGLIPSFGGGTRLEGSNLSNSIVLQKDSYADQQGNLPYVLKHEFKHKYLPEVSRKPRNYGYVLPESIQRFLSQYSPQDRGEELSAEAFAGAKMPEEVRSKLLRDIIFGVND